MDDFFDRRPRFRLSLHQLTALDVQPGELIAIAGALGCAHVCLFTHVPEQAMGIYPIVTEVNILAIASQMARHNVTICNIEVFPLDGGRLADFESSLTVGAALGATRATAHIHDADHSTAVARFAEFCDLAARYGIRAGLEFNAFSAVKDIHAAAAIVREAARPNGSLVLDMLHLFRSGGVASDVAAADEEPWLANHPGRKVWHTDA